MAFLSNLTLVVDTSALVAVAMREQGWEAFRTVLRFQADLKISAATYLELRIVMMRRLGESGIGLVDSVLATATATIIPVDAELASIAAGSLRPLRQGPSPGRAQLWRLLLLRTRQIPQRATPLQGRRLRQDRHTSRVYERSLGQPQLPQQKRIVHGNLTQVVIPSARPAMPCVHIRMQQQRSIRIRLQRP